MLAAATIIILSIALAFWMAQWVGSAPAFLLVAVLYLLLIILVVSHRKQWIEDPLVRFLTQVLMD